LSDDFNQVFGARRPNLAERIGRGEPLEVADGETIVGSGDYKPYGFLPTGIGETCEVTRWVDGTDKPEGVVFQYRFLMQVGFAGEEELRLYLPDCIILIQGKQLRELRRRLSRRQVTFITAWSARVWGNRSAEGEAWIERIEVLRPEKLAG
jgi:hypothetical protein